MAAIRSLLFAALLALPGTGLRAEPLRLGFDAYGGGVFLVHGELVLDQGRQDYRVSLEAGGGRLIDFFTRWSYRAEAEGSAQADGTLHPRHFSADRVLRGKRQTLTLAYGVDGSVKVAAEPPQSKEDAEAVPSGDRPGTLDPLSAAVAAFDAARRPEGCGGSWPVFDGRRRYDIRSERLGREVLERNDYSPFAGAADRCAIILHPVSGFSPPHKKDRLLRAGVDRRASIWFAPAGPDRRVVPVRIEVDLEWTLLVMHLVSVNGNKEPEPR